MVSEAVPAVPVLPAMGCLIQGLSLIHIFKRASIHSVRQLVEFSENDLLNIRNFGVKSIEEVKDKLESMGLSLKA